MAAEREWRWGRYLWLVPAVAVGVSAGVARAQAPAPAPGPAGQPTVVQFPATGVGLAEAVRLTLQHQPALQQAEAGLEQRLGAAQEQQGFFDWTLSSRIFYSYRQQELPESRKEIERNKRAQIRKGVEENRQNAQRAEGLLRGLTAVRNAPPGSPQLDAIAQIDPEIAAELRILDALISGTTNATTRTELTRVKQDFIDRLVPQLQDGLARSVQSFRDGESLLANLGEAPSDEYFYQFNGQVQVSRVFRHGLRFSPFFQGGVEGTNFLDKPRSAEFGGKGIEPLYTFRAGFNGVVPLMRGRGSLATAGAERAARIEVDASRLALQHQADVSVLETTLTYWDLRGAQAVYDVAERSVKNQGRLVELTRAQADVGTIPAIEVARVQASEARSRARLDDAGRALHEAQVALVDVMGLAVSDDTTTLPRAQDDFPATPAVEQLAEAAMAALAGEALERRADLRASVVSEESGRVLADTMATFLRSRLDIVNKTWWTSLDELVQFEDDPTDPDGLRRLTVKRSFSEALDRWVGPSVELALEYEKPLGNNQAKGRLAQQVADLRRREITSGDLRRLVRLGVLRSARSLAEAIDRVRNAEDAVKYYQTTIEGDFERFKSGDVTLIDTILTEEQQTDALLALVGARQQVAQLIAELRFQSGSLLTHASGQAPVVDPAALTTVPRSGGR
jgi:outer membrane protein TolC